MTTIELINEMVSDTSVSEFTLESDCGHIVINISNSPLVISYSYWCCDFENSCGCNDYYTFYSVDDVDFIRLIEHIDFTVINEVLKEP